MCSPIEGHTQTLLKRGCDGIYMKRCCSQLFPKEVTQMCTLQEAKVWHPVPGAEAIRAAAECV